MLADVPFVKNKRGSRATDPPNSVAERRMVALLGYTCDLYTSAGTLSRVQVVAPVVDAQRAGIPADWAGAFNLAPLPDLLGDGVMYAVDLRAASTVDAFYLDPAKRVRCLSELGWAAFRQRIGLSATRMVNHLDDLMDVGRDVWVEMALWERWNEAGAPPHEFQAWLDEPAPALGGFTLRSWLYRGAHREVANALSQALMEV